MSLIKDQIHLLVMEFENIKVQHKSEIVELKRKLADSEKRVVQIWEFVKDSNRKTTT